MSDKKLYKFVDYRYKPNATISPGSTADVIRDKLITGVLHSKTSHLKKGKKPCWFEKAGRFRNIKF